MNERTIDATLCGAKGFKALVDEHDGLFVRSCAEGRIFRGNGATVRAIVAKGFEVRPWTGPEDAKVSQTARQKAASRTMTFLALTPVGARVV